MREQRLLHQESAPCDETLRVDQLSEQDKIELRERIKAGDSWTKDLKRKVRGRLWPPIVVAYLILGRVYIAYRDTNPWVESGILFPIFLAVVVACRFYVLRELSEHERFVYRYTVTQDRHNRTWPAITCLLIGVVFSALLMMIKKGLPYDGADLMVLSFFLGLAGIGVALLVAKKRDARRS